MEPLKVRPLSAVIEEPLRETSCCPWSVRSDFFKVILLVLAFNGPWRYKTWYKLQKLLKLSEKETLFLCGMFFLSIWEFFEQISFFSMKVMSTHYAPILIYNASIEVARYAVLFPWDLISTWGRAYFEIFQSKINIQMIC